MFGTLIQLDFTILYNDGLPKFLFFSLGRRLIAVKVESAFLLVSSFFLFLLNRTLSVVSFTGFSKYVSVALVVPFCLNLPLLFGLSLKHHQFIVKGRVRRNNWDFIFVKTLFRFDYVVVWKVLWIVPTHLQRIRFPTVFILVRWLFSSLYILRLKMLFCNNLIKSQII